MSLGLMCHYYDAGELKWFQSAWAKTGKKLDMGKCCIRFKKLDDLALDVIGEAIRRVPAREYIAAYEKVLGKSAKKKAPARRRTARRSVTT